MSPSSQRLFSLAGQTLDLVHGLRVMMGYEIWDMVQGDIKTGMSMHAMFQALCGFLVFCLYRSSIHWNWMNPFLLFQ